LIGVFTALVAFMVDVAVATISDYKLGYCSTNFLSNRETCCTNKSPLVVFQDVGEDCSAWKDWSSNCWGSFGIYVGSALLFGIIAGSVTMTTKANLPSVSQEDGVDYAGRDQNPLGKSMYMAAGSGESQKHAQCPERCLRLAFLEAIN
jgi:chloride channel 3/4/5